MATAKGEIKVDSAPVDRGDAQVTEQRYRGRSQAVEAVPAEILYRPASSRLATECRKLDPAVERCFAEESFAGDSWPDY